MTNDLGVWTGGDCALVLIDYQQEMFEVIRSETSADLVDDEQVVALRAVRREQTQSREIARAKLRTPRDQSR